MNKIKLFLLSFFLLLPGCTSINQVNTPLPTLSENSTTSPIIIAAVSIKEQTNVFSGPSSTDYAILDILEPGTSVIPIASYGNFIQVQYSNDQKGFILKNALEKVPPEIPSILTENIEPVKINLLDLFYDPKTVKSNGIATIDCMQYNSFWGYEVGPFSIKNPISFKIDMTLLGQYGSVIISGRIPNQSMPFWFNRLSMYVNPNGYIDFRDGQDEQSVYSTEISGIAGKPFAISFPDKNGKTVVFESQTGETLASFDLSTLPNMNFPNGLFPEGQFYVGVTVAPKSKLEIHQLELNYVPDGIYQQPQVTLREMADQENIILGATLGSIYSHNTKLYTTLRDNFNGATIDFGWSTIEPERGVFDFSDTDPRVDFALQNNMKITGLHLLWGDRAQIPGWLLNGNYSKDELETILKEYIVALASHYKGKIYIWSIANEFTDRYLWGGDFWYDELGPDYIKLAFALARETDPNAILMLNEDGNESMLGSHAQVVSTMLSFVKKWQSEGMPIDAIGMQMHFGPNLNYPIPTKDQVKETIQKIDDLGLSVYITEFDINLYGVSGTQEEKLSFQANGYKEMFAACLESSNCKGFSIFGVSDDTSWLTTNYPDADPLIFDEKYNPKPAYYSLYDLLSEKTSTGDQVK